MRVRELVEKLRHVDPDLSVFCEIAEDQRSRYLDIESVTTIEGEPVRLGNEVPDLKVGRGENSIRLALLVATADF